MSLNKEISIVVPVYGCVECLEILEQRIANTLKKRELDYEIIFVNDNSPDGSWKKIKEICENNPNSKGINLSRNFGQHKAITAGLENANGVWIVVMDCDLQDQPEEIVNLYNKAKEGFDIVFGKRIARKDRFLKKAFSKIFYKILSYLTETEQDSTIANYGIYHKKVIDAVLSMKDSFRYLPTMVRWVGFKLTTINIDHASRTHGKTSYNFKKLSVLALDVMLAFSDRPLRQTVKLGFAISALSVAFAIITLIRYLLGDIVQPGYSSLIISIWFLSGIIISILGIVGLYIGRIFEKVKDRPLYIVDEKLNF